MATSCPTPVTLTGALRQGTLPEQTSLPGPSPSSPTSLPQHAASPLCRRTQLCVHIPDSSTASSRLLTGTGEGAQSAPPQPVWLLCPSPSSPSRAQPQHLTLPSSRSAQVWENPACTCVTGRPRPTTGTGDGFCPKLPSPFWPNA